LKKLISFIFIAILLISHVSCQKKQIANPLNNKQGVSVSFCIDILDAQEPIFTKPVLEALEKMEKSGLIKLYKQICDNKAEYTRKLSLCAQNSDLIIAGPLMKEELVETSELFPNKFFILLDFPAKGSNIASIVFREEDMAKRALIICQNNSKTKKIGAIFPGDPDSSLSIVLKHSLTVTKMDFIPVGTKSFLVLEKIKSWNLSQIDFIYLARASYLEEVITSLSKEVNSNLQVVCPRIILTDKTSPVFATIEKNYQPILEQLINEFSKKEIKPETYLVSDFISVLNQ
jgi:hypothetical protein